MRVVSKVIVAVALIAGLSTISTPASAAYNTKVNNQTPGWITLRTDGGWNVGVGAYGYAYGVNAVVVPRGVCYRIGTALVSVWNPRICATNGTVYYGIGSGNYWVHKVS